SQKGDTVVTNPTNARYDYSGSAIPDVYGAISSTLEFKGVGLIFQLNYQVGGKYYDNIYQGLMTPVYGGSLHADVLKSWKAPGDLTDIPRLDITSSGNFNAQSNRFLIDASYLNIRNVTLYYDLTKQLLSKLHIDQARFSITGE